MDNSVEQYDTLIRSGARRLTGYQRRLFQAEVATVLCGGCPRQAERRFGWGRDTVEKGLHEQQHGLRCLEDFAARGRRRSEQKDPQLAADIRAIVEPHTHTDPELKSARRYTNLSVAEVRAALIDRGYCKEKLPSERTLRDILNRMNYRFKRLQKGKPGQAAEEDRGDRCDLCEREAGPGAGPEGARDGGDLDGREGQGELGRLRPWGEKPGPTAPVRCPRAGITTRPRRRNWSRSAS
jgi:hypothetical protein